MIRQLTKKYLEKDKKMHAAFIDMEKAYDKVEDRLVDDIKRIRSEV